MNMNTVKKLQATAYVVMNQNVTFIRSNYCIVTEHNEKEVTFFLCSKFPLFD